MKQINTLEKEFVPYDLALKLKELGFDEECFGYYISTSYYNSKRELKYRNPILHHGYFNNKSLSEFEDDKTIQVITPLWQQAFDWLDKQFGLFVSFDKIDNTRKFYYDFSIIDSIRREYNDEDLIDSASRKLNWSEFKTYQEARQACLEKLIELVERGV